METACPRPHGNTASPAQACRLQTRLGVTRGVLFRQNLLAHLLKCLTLFLEQKQPPNVSMYLRSLFFCLQSFLPGWEKNPPQHLCKGERQYGMPDRNQTRQPLLPEKWDCTGRGTLLIFQGGPRCGTQHAPPPFSIYSCRKAVLRAVMFKKGKASEGTSVGVGNKELRPQLPGRAVQSYAQTVPTGDQISCHRRTKDPQSRRGCVTPGKS